MDYISRAEGHVVGSFPCLHVQRGTGKLHYSIHDTDLRSGLFFFFLAGRWGAGGKGMGRLLSSSSHAFHEDTKFASPLCKTAKAMEPVASILTLEHG